MLDKKFTLIIPFCNSSHYLDFWIRTIAVSNLRSFADIIIIDDYSHTDHYNRLVDQLQNVCIIKRNEKNLGSWAARISGIKLVRTEYFMFADADDEIVADELIRFVQQDGFSCCSDIYTFGFSKLYMNGTVKMVEYKENLLLAANAINHFFTENRCSKSLFARFYRTSSIRPILLQISDEVSKYRVAEDWFVITFLLSKNLQWEFRKEITYRHIKRTDSITVSDYRSEEIRTIGNNAIYELINRLIDSQVENKAIYPHLIKTLWWIKSAHYHPSFTKSIIGILNSRKILIFMPTTWLLLLKILYINFRYGRNIPH